MPQMQVTKKIQLRGPTIKLLFFVVSDKIESFLTEPIDVDNLALVRFYFFCNYNNTLDCSVAVRKNETIDSIIRLHVTCQKFEKQLICLDDWSKDLKITEKQASDFVIDSKDCKLSAFSLEVSITAQDATQLSSIGNQTLYEDKQFTDFKLSTPDGAVAVHKAVLATHSDVFRALLSDSKNTDGRFSIRGVTVQALQHLKEYMYLGTLPTSGLPELLLVAIHSKMEKLKNDCIMKLAAVVTAEDLDALIDFAVQNNIPDLVRAMLSVTPDSAVHGAHQARKNRLKFCTLNFGRLALE